MVDYEAADDAHLAFSIIMVICEAVATLAFVLFILIKGQKILLPCLF